MICYKTLENTTVSLIHETFVHAFSDYQIKIDLPFWKFENMLQRRGFVPEISMGAFAGETLIGFVLNGLRLWNGKLTVYNVGTGVVNEYRKQGVTTRMFSLSRVLLQEKNVEQYVLEVIHPNTSAIELYRKQGFKPVRSFACYQMDKKTANLVSAMEVERLDTISREDWAQLTPFWDYIPSWQNSIDSVLAVPDSFIYSIVRVDGAIAGYGILDKRTGDIPQLAVHKQFRRKGIAGSIVADLLNHGESNKIGVLNVDDESTGMKEFLVKSGFQYSVGQYEMILDLKEGQ